MKTIAIDFDGVLHAYSRGWEDGAIYDTSIEGSFEALQLLSKKFKVIVFTARNELLPVKKWLNDYYPTIDLEVTNRKPPAAYYIDDRAIRFDNWDATLDSISSLEFEAFD